MSLSNKDVREQLALLKDVTRRTGIIHDAQRLQLALWPRVVITNCFASTAEPAVRFDVDGKITERTMTFTCKTRGKDPDTNPKAIEALKDWTRQLLGDEWEVKVVLKREKLKVKRGR